MNHWSTNFFDDEYAAFGLANDPPEMIDNAADFIFKTLELKPGELLFDQCCGIGRMSIPLARRGVRIIGVDLTQTYVETARQRAQAEKLTCQFEVGDAFSFVSPQKCDAAINWFTSFSYSPNDADNQKQLQNLFGSLRPGGRLVMDYINIARTMADFRPNMATRPTASTLNGLIVVQENAPDFNTGMMHSHWTFIRQDGQRVEKRFAIRMYMPWDIVRLLRNCGFEVQQLLGSIEGEPFERLSKRLIVLARKPG